MTLRLEDFKPLPIGNCVYLSAMTENYEVCIEPLIFGGFNIGIYTRVTKELLRPKINVDNLNSAIAASNGILFELTYSKSTTGQELDFTAPCPSCSNAVDTPMHDLGCDNGR